MRYNPGIFLELVKTSIPDNLQNLLTGKKECRSSDNNKNDRKNKVIPMHHFCVLDTFDIFNHSFITV